MQQVARETIHSLQRTRARLGALQPGDTEIIIEAGAALEAVLGEIPEEYTEVAGSVMLCLHVLQAIYQEQTADFSRSVRCILAALAASEQALSAPPNPISELMLKQAQSELQKDLDQIGAHTATGEAAEIETTEPAAASPSLETLNDVASYLMQVELSDKAALTEIGEALKKISAAIDDTEKRKAIVKAARELARIVSGKSKNEQETLNLVGELIDSVNAQEEYAEEFAAELAPVETQSPIAEIEVPQAEIEVPLEMPAEIVPVETKPAVAVPVEAAAAQPVAAQSSQENESFSPDCLPLDSDMGLVAEFVVESVELLELAEVALLALETDPEDNENVNVVFRAFHTIKGSAAYLGLKRLTELAHHAESLLSRIRDREIRCTGGYANLALRSLDMLKEMLGGVERASVGEPMKLPFSYAELMKILKNPEANGINGETGQKIETKETKEKEASTEKDEESNSIGDILVSMGKITQAQMNEILANKGDQTIGAALVKEGLVSREDVSEAFIKHNNMTAAKKGTSADSSVRVRTDRLDSLIDMVGELVIAQSMLAQDATILQGVHQELSRKISHAGKIVRELQDLSMAMRMIPLKNTFQKMTRLVRDVANKCGKQVEFETEGEDTEIDRNMVDIIADPLVHMVRNAVDHGIERPETRTANGKSSTGKVRLSAYHAGGDVVVELADDGAGLDREKLVAKAISKNLIESDKGMSDGEVYKLIFAPGFSTAEQITDVSGRGVGMDVVRRNIEAMHGRIEISSEKGKGSVFTIRLPLTLAITDGMLVRVGEERYIVPTINIHLSFQPNHNMLSSVAGRGELVSLRGELMPIFRLHSLFDVKGAIESPTEGLLMIVADGRRRCALLVDELLGQQQVVTKTLGQGIGKIPGVSGGAILGDGCVGLILDTAEIVAIARENASASDRKNEQVRQAA